MIVSLETIRAVVRPYAARSIGLSDLLQQLWPLLLEADEDSKELAESIEDLLALHAAKSIDEVALRQRLIGIAFPAGTIADAIVSDVHSGYPEQVAGVRAAIATVSNAGTVELIPA